ncbi:acyl-CoA dehydrogenase, middle domain protein [Oesophagostomum dentatum]|uniref:Acyl-CoA dehydrogenase, middle domain protein n=1 Tax=Oesophagostomum dentatum TaxID=61180 RepID=A0A0B1RY36_OESDE|nr:acyl-CoA dehydrogenase, middle domain protein [Oesophagostomum dentatum]
MATPALAEFGSDSLRAEFLTPSMAGDMVACIAVSEPDAGSDVAAIRTRATRSGSDLIINGHKMWITNGAQADWACVLVNSNKSPSHHRNKSLVCVRLDEPGVHRTANIKKLGMHCSDTAEIFFDDVRECQR